MSEHATGVIDTGMYFKTYQPEPCKRDDCREALAAAKARAEDWCRKSNENVSYYTTEHRRMEARVLALEEAGRALVVACDNLRWTPTGAVAGLVPVEVALTALRAVLEKNDG